MTDINRLAKREPHSAEYDFPFDRIALSEPSREILERFWYQIAQRRPFKYDFPDMYEKEPAEFDEMFKDIADVIDLVILAELDSDSRALPPDARLDKITEHIFDRLLRGNFVDLKALIGVAVRSGAEAVAKKA